MAIEINGAGTITGISSGGLNDGIITASEIASSQVFSLNGVQFPATQVASADANTLDDYEEGTWTPTVSFGFGSVGITYSFREGRYSKVGNRVTATCYVALSSKGSSTGVARVESLPFQAASGNGNYVAVAVWTNTVSITGHVITAYVTVGNGYIDFNATPTGGNAQAAAALTEAHFANTGAFMITATYVAA